MAQQPAYQAVADLYQPGSEWLGKDANGGTWIVTINRFLGNDTYEVTVQDGFNSVWQIHKTHLQSKDGGVGPASAPVPAQVAGAPQWQIAIDGDTETIQDMWCTITDNIDQIFQEWRARQDGQKIPVNISIDRDPTRIQCMIDFNALVVEFQEPPPWKHVYTRTFGQEWCCVRSGCGRLAYSNQRGNFCGNGCKRSGLIHLPLRRFDGVNCSEPPEHTKHPWYLQMVQRREMERGPGLVPGAQDWLTNDFFWEAFKAACQIQGGEAPNMGMHEFFDFRYNKDYRNAQPNYARRGGVLYKEPVGWKRFAINTRKKYNDTAWMNDWAVAYHGCPMKSIPLIMNSAFRPGPLQGAKKCKDNRTDQPVGEGIYCSPNPLVNECYSNGEEGANKGAACTLRCMDGKRRTLFFALQCRVNPEAIRRPDRPFARCNDEEVMGLEGVFEWLINNPDDIRPYAVMVRDKEGCDHRTLKDLVDNWNKENKPLPPDAPDTLAKVPTDPCRTPEQQRQIDLSRARAEQALR